jgi:hypothetical protein
LGVLAERADAADPVAAVLSRCRELLQECGQGEGPVGLKPFLEHLGAQQDRRPMDTWGRLTLRDDGWRISVRETTPYRRARFTVAHEVGHILLCEMLADEPRALRALQEPGHWPVVERLCNITAAELLMPQEDFRRTALRVSVQPVGLRQLYDRYLVSWEPLLLRITEIFGGSMIPFARYRRHAAERVTWRVVRSAGNGAVWMPQGLTTRYLRPDIVRSAAMDGFASAVGMHIDMRARQKRIVAAMAVSVSAARDSAGCKPTVLEGFEPPDEQSTPFDVALFAHPNPDSSWRQLADAPTDPAPPYIRM